MRISTHWPGRLAGAAAVACAAALTPTVALAAAGTACRTHPVTAYVLNDYSGTVTPIRTATSTAGKAINVTSTGLALAITPDGRKGYVVNGLLFVAVPFSTATGRVGKPIPVGQSPLVIAITPNGRTAYVLNTFADTVTPISTATNKAGKQIPAGGAPGDIAFTPNGRTACCWARAS